MTKYILFTVLAFLDFYILSLHPFFLITLPISLCAFCLWMPNMTDFESFYILIGIGFFHDLVLGVGYGLVLLTYIILSTILFNGGSLVSNSRRASIWVKRITTSPVTLFIFIFGCIQLVQLFGLRSDVLAANAIFYGVLSILVGLVCLKLISASMRPLAKWL